MSASLSNLYTEIRNAIGDEGESGVNQEYTDSQLAHFIANAVTRYSEFAPHVLVTTLTSVADQADYALPSAAVAVRQVKWRDTPYTVPSNLTPTLNLEWQDDALLAVRDQLIANFDRLTQTSWAVVNYAHSYMGGLYLRLYPAPTTADEDIQVWYTTAHSLVGSQYPTIPANHASHVAKLAYALILRREARIMLRQPDINAGQGLRVGSAPAQRLLQESQQLEQEVYDALSTPVGSH